MRKLFNNFKIALALGGGGVRGFAHIGVINVLQKNKVKFDLIVGTSMGAIIGAAYCLSKDLSCLLKVIEEIPNLDKIKELKSLLAKSNADEKKLVISKFFDSLKSIYLWNTKKYIMDSEEIKSLIAKVIPPQLTFQDLLIPFACIATDIFTAEEVILKEGNLLNAVLASSSLPAIFSPLKIGKRILVDGGILSLVPAPAARKLGANFVIGINVEGLRLKQDLKNGIEILFQVDQIRAYHLNKLNLNDCDFVFEPKVKEIGWADFSQAKYCIEKGEEEAEEKISELKIKLKRAKLKHLFSFKIA